MDTLKDSASHALEAVATYVRDQATAYCESSKVPGYVAGVYQHGVETVISHGVANIATGAPMLDDTGFLFGSVTKLMTATLAMQQLEQGAIDLDEPVMTYLPEFKLQTPGAAERIRIRNLLNHTNGIDADFYVPEGSGPGALKIFVEQLGKHCGALFSPGEFLSYSNGGMNLMGRVLEVVTRTPYHDLLERDVYAPVGMLDSSTTAEQAILRSTAVGHFPDFASGGVRRTDMFKLPDTWAACGATPIGTVHDLLSFARTHLGGGQSPIGNRVLSPESIARMQSVTHDMGTPNVPPVGLGWLLMPYGGTTVLAHSGASPGGVALLALVPEYDLAFAAFGNDSRAIALHDQLLIWLIREHLGVDVPDLITETAPVSDLAAYAGTYRSNQLHVDVRVVDGQLEETSRFEPLDATEARIVGGFMGVLGGAAAPFPPRRYVPIRENLFAPAGMPLQAFNGYMRSLLVSYSGDNDGRRVYRSMGGRMTRRAS